MAILGISERNIEFKAVETKGDNRNIFLKFWETYISNRNAIISGYLESFTYRSCYLERELLKDERYTQIPHIYYEDERHCVLFPICFSERKCEYKRFWIEENDKTLYLIPICCSDRIVYMDYWFSSSNDRIIDYKRGGNDFRHILTKLPPLFTAYTYKKCIAYHLPPNTDERSCISPCFHVNYHLPLDFQQLVDDCNDYSITLINDENEICEKTTEATTTDNKVSNDIIGLTEGFDYGELFIVDLNKGEIHNLSLDSVFILPIFNFGDYMTKDLYVVSNQDNLLIRIDMNVNLAYSKDLFSFTWQDFQNLYPDDERKAEIEFSNWLVKYLLEKNYINIKLFENQLSWDWQFFRKFPRRFLNDFFVYMKDGYKDCIFGIKLIYYFPYRFKNPHKGRKNLLIFDEFNV